MSALDLWQRLQKRKLVQWGVAYVAAVFALLQGVDIIAAKFGWPDTVGRVLIIVSFVGFFVTLLLAWYHGERGAQKVSGTELLILSLLLAIGGGLLWMFSASGQPLAMAVPEQIQADAKTPDATSATTVSDNSVAVLPFVNMSGDSEQEYFSDGMTEELLNVLARMPKLKVAARTSVFEFKGKSGDVREIGRKLGVGHIVEGSVRRDGQQIRVTAQLIRVSDGFHVWSETYDRKLEGVFALQDDLARRIGQQLDSSIGNEVMQASRTEIPSDAYEDYLKGRALYRSRKDLEQAVAYFQAAVARAPDFAEGWASLSLTYEVIKGYTAREQRARLGDVFAKCKAAAVRAAALAPDSAMVLHALANVARFEHRFADAQGMYQRSIRADPTYPDVREDYGEMLDFLGHYEDSLRESLQLVELDPYSRVFWEVVLFSAYGLDRRAEVDEAVAHLQSIDPNAYYGVAGHYLLELYWGRIDAARAELAKAAKAKPELMAEDVLLFRWASGEPGVDPAAVDEVFENSQREATPIMYAVWRGDFDRVFDFYRAPTTDAKVRMWFYDNVNSAPSKKILADPRARQFLRDNGFEAYWREKGWPSLCRPLGDDDFECGPAVRESRP